MTKYIHKAEGFKEIGVARHLSENELGIEQAEERITELYPCQNTVILPT